MCAKHLRWLTHIEALCSVTCRILWRESYNASVHEEARNSVDKVCHLIPSFYHKLPCYIVRKAHQRPTAPKPRPLITHLPMACLSASSFHECVRVCLCGLRLFVFVTVSPAMQLLFCAATWRLTGCIQEHRLKTQTHKSLLNLANEFYLYSFQPSETDLNDLCYIKICYVSRKLYLEIFTNHKCWPWFQLTWISSTEYKKVNIILKSDWNRNYDTTQQQKKKAVLMTGLKIKPQDEVSYNSSDTVVCAAAEMLCYNRDPAFCS